MTITLEQLLLLARLDSKDESKKVELIELPAIVNELLAHFKREIQQKELQVSLEYNDRDEFLVPNYYTYLILENILSNAIKYSKIKGKLIIACHLANDRINCTIKDEGIGIKQEDLQHIYDNFFRSDALNHKQIKGNGLGLSIVKKAADAINAQIEINSKLSKGTEVQISFPIN